MVEFGLWMSKVDREIARVCGFTHEDLPDYCYRDAFEDERSPKEVAWEVLEEAGFPV